MYRGQIDVASGPRVFTKKLKMSGTKETCWSILSVSCCCIVFCQVLGARYFIQVVNNNNYIQRYFSSSC